MPLVKVHLPRGRSAEAKDAIATSIQAALVGTLGVPEAGQVQLFQEYDATSVRHGRESLGVTDADQRLIVELTFPVGRDDEQKTSLLAEINRNLVAAGVARADDVLVLISEIGRANVSFGQGLAQRAPTSSLAI